MSTNVTQILPIAGWQGKVSAEAFKRREDDSDFTIEGIIDSPAPKIATLVQNVRITSDFASLREPRLGTRKKVLIPTPVEFAGSFDVINNLDNNWLMDLMLGYGSEYNPVHFTLMASNLADTVGVILDECYLIGHETTIAANGTMKTRYNFVALAMTKAKPSGEPDGAE